MFFADREVCIGVSLTKSLVMKSFLDISQIIVVDCPITVRLIYRVYSMARMASWNIRNT